MASFARHVDVEWNGTLMEGNGTATAGTGAFTLPVTFPSRINETGDGKTTPEELLAGAHAICYAMVLTNTIGKQGGKARRVRVTATVTADKSERARDECREGLPDLERDPRHRCHFSQRVSYLIVSCRGPRLRCSSRCCSAAAQQRNHPTAGRPQETRPILRDSASSISIAASMPARTSTSSPAGTG